MIIITHFFYLYRLAMYFVVFLRAVYNSRELTLEFYLNKYIERLTLYILN